MPAIPHSLAALCLATPWVLRYGSLPTGIDIAGVTTLAVFTNKSAVAHNLVDIFPANQGCWHLTFYGCLLCAVLFTLDASWQVWRFGGRAGDLNNKIDNGADSSHLKPLLFPCRTSHTRLFPKKHSFSYSYLLVGIPVGWRGSAGSLLSADTESLQHSGKKSAWFHVESANYLERGESDQGLRGKLDNYLRSQVCKCLIIEGCESIFNCK